jgi:hypothetical protein
VKNYELIKHLLTLDPMAEVVGISDHDASAGCEYKITKVEPYTMEWYSLQVQWMGPKPQLYKSVPTCAHQKLLLPSVSVIALQGGEFLLDENT